MLKKRKLIIAIVVLALVVWGVMKYRSQSSALPTDTPTVQTSAVKESTVPLEVHAIGSVAASRNVEVSPEMPGHVVKILFQDGALVKEGQLLVQLNDAAYKTKLQVAKARLVLSEGKFSRMQQLAKKGFVSQQTIDEVEADLKEKRADAKESEVMVNRMSLEAPFGGVVGKSKVNAGDYVNVGQSLVTITDIEHLRIEFSVPEKYLADLKIGEEVKVTTSSYPGKIFLGKLAYIAPTISADNRSISLYADILNPDHTLKPGMFVDVMQSLGTKEHAMMVPARALVPVLEGQQIYKVVSGKVVATNVTVGARVGDNVQIEQGVSPGDAIITDGQLKVKNGMPVKTKT